MPQISLSVDQEAYDLAKAAVARHGDVSLTNAVRKLITCYGKGVIYFRGRLPEISDMRREEMEAEIFLGEAPVKDAPIKEEAPVFDPSSVPPVDWEQTERDLAKEKAQREKLVKSDQYKGLGKMIEELEPKIGKGALLAENSIAWLKLLKEIKSPEDMSLESTTDCWWNPERNCWERPTDAFVIARRSR